MEGKGVGTLLQILSEVFFTRGTLWRKSDLKACLGQGKDLDCSTTLSSLGGAHDLSSGSKRSH